MNLVPFTYGGATITDNIKYSTTLDTEGMLIPSNEILEVNRTNNFPAYAGKEFQSKLIPIKVELIAAGTPDIDELNKIFDPTDTDEKAFVCKDLDDSNKLWYVDAVVKSQTDYSANYSEYLLYAADPLWKTLYNGGTLTVSMASSSAFGTIAVGGNKEALPVFFIIPTQAKGTEYAYRRFVTLYNTSNRDFGNYPVNLTDNGTGTAYIAGSELVAATKMIFNAADLRIFVDGSETYRYIGGTPNSGTTKVWANINLPTGRSMTLGTAIGTSDSAGTIWFEDTQDNKTAIKALPATGLLDSNGEIFSYLAKDWPNCNVSGVTRSAKLTSAGSHAVGGTFNWIPHDIWMVYGNPAATTLTIDYNYKPAFDNHVSNNKYWSYTEFGEYDGKRKFMWIPGKAISQGGLSHWYTGNEGTTKADPIEEMGCAVQAWKNGSRWQSELANIVWNLYQPAGATTLVYSGEKYIATSNSWPDIINGFSYTNGIEYTYNKLAAPASYGSWQSFSGTITPASGQRYWRWQLYGSIMGAASNTTYLECGSASLYLDEYPYVSLGTENNNYHLFMAIRNNTTGEKMWVKTVMGLNETLVIDCNSKVVYLQDDGTNLINALTLDSVRDEWFTLSPGTTNLLDFGEAGATGVNIIMVYRERNL